MSKPKRICPGDGDPRHGTYNGYQNLKCRCPDCTAAKAAYMDQWRRRRGEQNERSNLLLVTCWCEASVVWVRDGEVRAGRTASCRRPECKPPATAAA